MPANAANRKSTLYLAFFLIYFIWGSTYLAIRYAVSAIPPFLMAGTRFFGAGLAMMVFLHWRGVALPSWSQYWRLAVVGVFLFLGGNGLVVWAEQTIDSGLAALLVSTLPLWLIVGDWLWAGGRPPTPRALTGIVLGIVGTVLLVKPGLVLPVQGRDTAAPALDSHTVFASLVWAIGSIYQKTFKGPESVFMSAASQMSGGGLALLLVALVQGEWGRFDPAALTLPAVAGFGFLVVFGSMVAITAYVWLLQNASAQAVSSYAFVNPLVALVLGWLIADEPLTTAILLGAAIILAGVVLVVSTPRR